MTAQGPRDRIAAIILGASEWPLYPALEPSTAHANSARAFRQYLRDPWPRGLGLPARHVLDLFDTDFSVIDLDETIRNFLEERNRDPALDDLIVLYTGHGGFTTRDEYYLAIRATKKSSPDITGYKVATLARSLNALAGGARRLLFLDCCFAGAAVGEIVRLDDPLAAAVTEVEDCLPASGTALFCAASRKTKARIIGGEPHTMFAGALLHALSAGDADRGDILTVGELGGLLEAEVRRRYADLAIRPELHYPEQREGTLATLPFFPNVARLGRDGAPSAAVSESELDVAACEALLEAADRLTAQIALPTLLNELLVVAGRIVGCEAASVILYDKSRGDLYFAAASGPAADKVTDLRIPADQGIAGKVFRTGVSIVEDRVAEHYDRVDHETDFSTRSMICVPLRHGATSFGVLQLLNKQDAAGRAVRFDRRDQLCAERIATQAAIALRNTMQFESLLASVGLCGAREIGSDLIEMMTDPEARPTSELATVMFADMRGFTRLSHLLGEGVLIAERLSQFLEIVTGAVIERNGIVNKFLGDGVLTIFRGEQAARNAVCCAFDIQSRARVLFGAWCAESNHDLSFLEVGFGISSDRVLLGLVGAGFARDFTVIGLAVNLAAGLEHQARNGRWILCDNRTYQAVKAMVTASGPRPFSIDKPDQPQRPPFPVYCLEALVQAQPSRNGVQQSIS